MVQPAMGARPVDPRHLALAQQFMRNRPAQPVRRPPSRPGGMVDMGGFSRTPMGRNIMQRVLRDIAARRGGGGSQPGRGGLPGRPGIPRTPPSPGGPQRSIPRTPPRDRGLPRQAM